MKKISLFFSALCLSALLAAPVQALEVRSGSVYCFSPADFPADAGSGVLLTDVPDAQLGCLLLEGRRLRAGDALTGDQLSQLTFVPSGELSGSAVISCVGLGAEGPEMAQMTLKVGKNEPPVAEDSTFKTYKNIPGQVPLTVSDPDGDALTVTIVKAPKRGTCDVSDDGTVTYTPTENKVGKDAFTYTVTDTAGNVSEEATVRIEIQKPSDKQTYGDLEGDPALLAATWLREEGIYSGEVVAGQLLFGPEETVSRGEFIAMCAGLTGLGEDAECLSTGFVDDGETPDWLGRYVSQALRCGYLSGIPTSDGLALNAGAQITQAQAVKMISTLLGLPQADSAAVMAVGTDIPAWAAASAASAAGADLYTVTAPDAALTRREAALLLYRAGVYGDANAETSSLLSWAKK